MTKLSLEVRISLLIKAAKGRLLFSEINQPIEVTASFSENKLIPRQFIWHGREIEITKVNLTYHVWEGRSKIYYFAVSDNVNDFKLRFDTDKLTWILVESYAE